MRSVLLTSDYEIFGNGSGDVRQHMVDPTERMARICEKHGVPLTLFVEMEETLAFQRNAPALRQSLGYDPYAEIRCQVQSLARRGHDIQLHLHPEWHGANLHGAHWQLDFTRATVDSLFPSVQETTSYIANRKAALEEMAGGTCPVIAYRAGAFSAQPGQKLISALANNQFAIDSSVVHGVTRKTENVCLDYRNAPVGKAMWRVEKDVAVEQPGGSLWEIPIASRPGRRFHQLTFGRLKAKFSKHIPKEQQSRMVKQLGVRKNPFQFVRFLAQQVPIKFDFHNVNPDKLVNMIKAWPAPPSGLPDVVVLIGHSKEHIDDHGFEDIVRRIKQAGMQIVGFDKIAAQLPSSSGNTGCPSGRTTPVSRSGSELGEVSHSATHHLTHL